MAGLLEQLGEDLVLLKSEVATLRETLRRRQVALKNFYWLQPRDYHGRWAIAAGGSTDFSAAKRRLEADCDLQYSKDTMICNLVKTPLCWAQAMERYSACLSGRPIPQLRF
ncbi:MULTISPECIES: hypothetical protein [Rhodopseudomonas]|uniref:hypothetical protein n=1 Tax=Rhodopseudomonas TaxID=1073 RepID=UPI0012377693|nr:MULTISPECIES: hypothetical protein [Rhodopseudomonas]